MTNKNGKGREHRHEWQQAAVTLQQGKGRATGLTVRWECAGRKCDAATITQLTIRKPAANARPTGENVPASRREVKAAVDRARQSRKERGTGSLAAMAADDSFEELAEEFERPAGEGNGRRPRTVEEARAGILLYATAADVEGVA